MSKTLNLQEAIENINTFENLKTIIEYYGHTFQKDAQGYKTCCPFHNEKTPSFRIKEKNCKVFYKCFGSCNAYGDLVNFIEKKENLSTYKATKKAYEILNIPCEIEVSKLDNFISFIQNESKNSKNYNNSYVYRDIDNTPLYLKVKYVDENNKKTFITKALIETEKSYKYATSEEFSKTKKVIYNYKRVTAAIEKEQNIYFVEGEKDADNLIRLGFTATTIYSKKWDKAYNEQLKNAKIVFIGDTGKAGEEFKNFIYENVKDFVLTFKVVELPEIEQLGDNKDVSDWLEVKGNTKEKLIQAIKNSWDWLISTKWKDVKITEKNNIKQIKPLKTIDNLKLILKRNNTKLYFNEISKQVEIETTTFKNSNMNTFITELQTQAIKEGLNCTSTDVSNWINAIAYENSINPFKVYLDNLKDKWDKNSRLEEFLNCFKTVESFNQNLKKKIFRYWLLQFIDSAYNPEFKSQGILVLKGNQGIFKTSSMECLIPIKNKPWVFLSEQKFEQNRDCIQTITSNQLVELSEFARSNKAIDELKAFITKKTDKLVLKYDKYPIEYKRKTVFYATVNDAEFLLDDENRRFWIIDLMSIDIEKIKKFDFEQLWAELYYIYHVEGDKKCYFDKEELPELEESNQGFKFKGELENLIEMTFDFNDPRRIWLTTAEVTQFLGKIYSSTKITRTLKSMRIEQKQFNNKTMPNGKYNAMPLPKFLKGKVKQEYKNRLVNIKIVENNKIENDKQENLANEQLLKENEQLQKEIENLKNIILKYEIENQNLQEEIEILKNQKEVFKAFLKEAEQ